MAWPCPSSAAHFQTLPRSSPQTLPGRCRWSAAGALFAASVSGAAMRPSSLAKSESLVACHDIGLGLRPPAPLARRRGWRRALRARYDQRHDESLDQDPAPTARARADDGAASARQRTFYDSSGGTASRSATDSQGSITFYDSRGRVITRETTSGNMTTIYDAGGRNVGRVTTSPQR
jgi:YD repeat-containing protein